MSDLRFFLEAVPDPRSRRGRWYSLTSILLVCAAAAVSGARAIDELAEWGARADAGLLATLGVRRHLLCWRHAPSRSAIGRVLERLDTDALDAAVGAWLAHRHTAAAPGRRRVIAVKANVAWLAETKKAHYVAVIKPNQPTAWAQLDGLDWHAVAIQHTASNKGHGRRESRSIKTLAIADNL
ncbi:transposase family protein, partial [Streptomyces sp. NRRL S-15]|uniref:transposase family protein n=1 Tax=Streptomyces sp. NRRL S-15 TaxID=1463886 RepID=UPI001900807B